MTENRSWDCDFIKETQSGFSDAGLIYPLPWISTRNTRQYLLTVYSSLYYFAKRAVFRGANDLYFVQRNCENFTVCVQRKTLRISDTYIGHFKLQRQCTKWAISLLITYISNKYFHFNYWTEIYHLIFECAYK